jgi:hypothetical protein
MKVSRQITAISALVLSLSTIAWATPLQLNAIQDQGVQSSFMLDFGGGFTETSNISSTNYELAVDGEPLPAGFAQFLSYNQAVDSITLPDGQGGPGIPTGAITVTILDGTSTGGTYDPASGQFTTSEHYNIHFANDLSQLGFPGHDVEFPSSSTGTIQFLTPNSGTIHQEWSGFYAPLNLNYVCQVNTEFTVPEPASLALMGFAGIVLLRRRR